MCDGPLSPSLPAAAAATAATVPPAAGAAASSALPSPADSPTFSFRGIFHVAISSSSIGEMPRARKGRRRCRNRQHINNAPTIKSNPTTESTVLRVMMSVLLFPIPSEPPLEAAAPWGESVAVGNAVERVGISVSNPSLEVTVLRTRELPEDGEETRAGRLSDTEVVDGGKAGKLVVTDINVDGWPGTGGVGGGLGSGGAVTRGGPGGENVSEDVNGRCEVSHGGGGGGCLPPFKWSSGTSWRMSNTRARVGEMSKTAHATANIIAADRLSLAKTPREVNIDGPLGRERTKQHSSISHHVNLSSSEPHSIIRRGLLCRGREKKGKTNV